MSNTVLVIDDEPMVVKMICRVLSASGYEARGATTLADMEGILQDYRPALALVDVRMDTPGIEVLRLLKGRLPGIEVIMMSGHGDIHDAVECIQNGASDFLPKPFPSNEGLIARVRLAIRNVDDEENQGHSQELVWGSSPAMENVKRIVKVVGPSDATVLITGETGTGKEVIAWQIHKLSARNHRSFVPVNCSALSENLIEGELFGHERGSFTGAVARKHGLFHEADGGSLFLDEVGELPRQVQAKLLRALQEGEVRRVGATVTENVDVRILAATNRSLDLAVEKGEFREDLYYRLNIVHLDLPPLRDRQSDILTLAKFFLKRFNADVELTEKSIEVLLAYEWPGNIRELRNVIEHASLFSEQGRIFPHNFPKKLLAKHTYLGARAPVLLDLEYQDAKSELLRHFDRLYFESLLERVDNNMSRAARLAGMDKSNFRKQLLKSALI